MRIPHEIMVAVRRGDEFLVLHRSPQFEAYWHLVAGGIEQGEEPRAAALRELREEVGLETDELLDLERRYVYPLADEPEAVRARFDPSATEVLVDVFVADVPEGWEPTLNDEHDDYRWCSGAQAAELLFWPEPQEVVRELASA